ncbi:unnamed protein product [Diatraea saccharalis]|uniref:DUF4817 domain-containing protein n=1 Tax=Diatraea saccharalis TaxID=40085 RepID=A0A9N9N4Q7_9NEOP|nr:unnamed protein product [Diatraea saccharalis]
MYHYSNQSIYNYDVYSQCSVVDLNKNLNETISLTEHNQYQSNTENVSFTTLTTSHSTPTETRNNGTERKEKLTEKTVVDTSNFSIEERLVAAVWVHERKRTNVGMSQIKRDFRQRFGRQPPAKNTLLAWERKLFSTGSVRDAPRPGRPVNRYWFT